MMDYFVRPKIAGRNLKRLSYATIRGDVRRSDADITSSVPYFPGLAVGMTMNISTQAADLQVTFTGNALATVLNDINSALTAFGGEATAYENDGTIYIRSNVPGSDGYVSVPDGGVGSASEALGFLAHPYSRGGDLMGAPEGRVRNPFGATFPGRGENFAMDTLRASLGRLAGNADVLFADIARCDAVLRKVTDFTNNGSYLAVGNATRVFTGPAGGFLSRSSSKSDLAPFFLLIDSATKQPLINKVSGVIRNSTTAPVADASAWTGTGNVLGRNLTKGLFTITGIERGVLVRVSGNIQSAGVVVGDFAEISGATNNVPFSNNGCRWVVEEIPTNAEVVLRPASQSEMTMFGNQPTVGVDSQPVLELNDAKGTGEDWGSVTFRSGPFCNGVNLLVSPPLGAGVAFELWAAVPRSIRTGLVEDAVRSDTPVTKSVTADDVTSPNGFYTAPTASVAGSSVTVSQSTARIGGRLLTVPGLVVDTVAQPPDSDWYIRWTEESNSLDYGSAVDNIVIDPNDPTGDYPTGNPAAQPVFRVRKDMVGSVTVFPCTRLLAEATRTITVGAGGQFTRLDSAIEFLNGYVSGEGVFPLREVVLVSNSTVEKTVTVKVPNLIIRGGSPEVTLQYLNQPLGPLFKLEGADKFILENFKVDARGISRPILIEADGNARVTLRNMSQKFGGGSLGFAALVTPTSSQYSSLTLEDCYFYVHEAITHTVGDARLSRSVIVCDDGGQSQMFMRQGQGGISESWLGSSIQIQDCTFHGWTCNTSTDLVVFDDGNDVQISIERSRFYNAAFPSTSTARLLTGNTIVLRDCVVTGGCPNGVYGGDLSIIEGCQITTFGSLGGVVNRCGTAVNNTFANLDAMSGAPGVGATVLSVFRTATGNSIIGTASTAIESSYSALISGNSVDLSTGTLTKTIKAIKVSGTHSKVIGNHVLVSGGSVTATSWILEVTGAGSGIVLCGNYLSSSVSNVYGVFLNTTGTLGNEDRLNISSNIVRLLSSTAQLAVAFGTGGCPLGTIQDNSFLCNPLASSATALRLPLLSAPTSKLRLNISGNHLHAGTSWALEVDPEADLSEVVFTGNNFVGNISNDDGPLDNVSFRDNHVTGTAYFGNNNSVTGNVFDRVEFHFGGYVNTTVLAAEGSFSNNEVSDLVVLRKATDKGTNAHRLVIQGCLVTGSASLTQSNVQCSVINNVFKGAVTHGYGKFDHNSCLSTYSSTAVESVIGNAFHGTVSIWAHVVSGNSFLNTGTSTVSCYQFVGNKSDAAMTLDGAMVSGNVFLHASSAVVLKDCEAENNSFAFNVQLGAGSFSGNSVSGDVVLRGSARVINNTIEGSISHSTPLDQFVVAYDALVMGNSIAGPLNLTTTTLADVGWKFVGNAFMDDTSDKVVSGFKKVEFTDNDVASSIVITTGSNGGSSVRVAENRINGNLLVESLGEVRVSNNDLSGGSLSVFAYSEQGFGYMGTVKAVVTGNSGGVFVLTLLLNSAVSDNTASRMVFVGCGKTTVSQNRVSGANHSITLSNEGEEGLYNFDMVFSGNLLETTGDANTRCIYAPYARRCRFSDNLLTKTTGRVMAELGADSGVLRTGSQNYGTGARQLSWGPNSCICPLAGGEYPLIKDFTTYLLAFKQSDFVCITRDTGAYSSTGYSTLNGVSAAANIDKYMLLVNQAAGDPRKNGLYRSTLSGELDWFWTYEGSQPADDDLVVWRTNNATPVADYRHYEKYTSGAEPFYRLIHQAQTQYTLQGLIAASDYMVYDQGINTDAIRVP